MYLFAKSKRVPLLDDLESRSYSLKFYKTCYCFVCEISHCNWVCFDLIFSTVKTIKS